MGTLLKFWSGTRLSELPTEGTIPVLDADTLLQPHRALLNTIRQLVGVPQAHWDELYAAAFEAYALFVQQLPASEAHHHAGPGGMLTHGLEVVCEALKLRRGRLLPSGAAAEEMVARQDRWTYATATAALLHDLGKPVTDLRVRLYNENDRGLGWWDPWGGPMTGDAAWYRVEFVRDRRYRFHERVPPLLVHFIFPRQGLSWLASDPEVLQAWLATISGDAEQAGIIGEMVHQADGLSVVSDLAGTPASMPTARRKSLSMRLLTGLRYLLDQGDLPLNRPGAAGWRSEEDLWLVSKRVLDILREHLHHEGQEGVPTRNDRLMDELQQHGILRPNDDRAIWTVQVIDGDWSQQLTVLRFPVHTLWPEPDARPPVFAGTVTPINTTSSAVENNEVDEVADHAVAVLHDRPSQQMEQVIHQHSQTTKPGVETDDAASIRENANSVSAFDTPSSDSDESSSRTAGHVSFSPSQETDLTDEVDPGRRFLAWIKEGLSSGRLPINTVNARVHTVSEGLMLVSPGIFKDYDRENWSRVQKRFLKQKLHQRTTLGTNVWTYQVKGARKQSRINGLLIAEPEAVLGLRLPPPNTHLTLKV
ncbi:MAG: helicase/relaxase domain-containing protein [Gammaproteobacteria bacterium]|nr:helicase/relaxase domain-containing protein [Gammaproteobacteria bacterium]